MTLPFDPLSIKFLIVYAYVGAVLAIHLRGRARLRFDRQLVDHSALFAPYNLLMYAFSKVPSKPVVERARFAELDALKGHWQTIRAEALALAEGGHIRKAEGRNDASFDSFFRQGWKRYYLKWYGNALPSAQAQCPRTVALVNAIPSVKAAMFTLLPPGSKLNAHRDPFAGSLRYHLGLVTPNSPACRILVDGEELVWRDGEDFMFDETFVHWAENKTEHTRVILFCDIERPLYTPLLRALNRAVSRFMGQATATDNVPGEPVGAINRLYARLNRFNSTLGNWKRRWPRSFRAVKYLLILAVLALIFLR
ncbi:MAG: aspartyl/asparaginyl beta-hydroxylase domain-containing protein [Proteobacteria bacterium]|nr:aspartyl/asparaginyl beta-hydroxylase domain-containing protein [Pseudomonadota bacterium]